MIPKYGDKLTDTRPVMAGRRRVYHVRAIVDYVVDEHFDVHFVAVLRRWEHGHWAYTIAVESDFATGRYVPHRRIRSPGSASSPQHGPSHRAP